MNQPAAPHQHRPDAMLSRRELLAIVFLRKWSILAVFTATVAAAAFVTLYLISPNFEAKSKLIINTSDLVVPIADAPPSSDFEKLTAFHTQKDVLTSVTLVARVVERLNLAETRVIGNMELLRMWLRDVRSVLGGWFGIERWQKPWDAEAAAVAYVHDRLEVTGSPDSRALEISYRSKHPQEAADTVNVLIEEFTDYFHGEVRARAQGLHDYLASRVTAVETDLEQVESALLEFKRADTVQLDGGATDDRPRNLTGVTDSQTVQAEIKIYILKMEAELRERLTEVSPTHPSVVALQNDIRTYTDVLNDLPQRELTLLRLGRELNLAQEKYALVKRNLERAAMISAGSTSAINIINVLEPAQAADSPVSPKPRLTIALATVFGAVFGVIFALFMHFMDHSIRAVRDVETHLGLRTLGSLPRI